MRIDVFHLAGREGWRRLGHGRRLGETWLTELPGGQRVVLKRLAGLAAAAGEAAELLDRVSAVPSCVAALGVEPRDGDLWVAYPFLPGTGPVEAASLGTVGDADIERAVSELHSAGLVHGALCDSNVLVTETGEVRLLEAGLAGIGCLGAVGIASRDDDRRDLAVLLRQMRTEAAHGAGSIGDRSRRRARGATGVRARLAVLAVAVSAVALITGVPALLLRAQASAPVVRADITAGRSRPHPSPPSQNCISTSLPGVAGATYLAVDITGSGCAEPMYWSAGVVVTVSPEGRPMRFSLGRAGDVLLVGHWSCSRRDLPALYRRDTGQIFLFRSWPVHGDAVTSEPAVATGIRGGRARTAGLTGCQRIEVVP